MNEALAICCSPFSKRLLPPKRVTASGRSTYDVTCAFIVKVSHRTGVAAMVPSQPLRTASDAGAPVDPDASAQNLVPSWLPKAKVLAPALPAGYVRHASLLHHLEGLLERRLTVLRAPAGFGKTTVLADVVCGVKAQGLVAGWISLDEDDAPNLFGSCLASAFEHAGLDLALINVHDAWSSSPAVHQLGMLARAIEPHAAPCLLVLDEVDRLPRSTVELINLLLTRAPANLHLAMAFRSDPGLDLATHVLDGEAIVVGVRQCRFSTADIARFFHGTLSRRELATVVERTAGWPVALLVYRNTRAHEAKGLGTDAARLTENYVGVRLLDTVPESAGLAEESNDERKAARKAFFPSSIGLSFLVAGACRELAVTVRWGAYAPADIEEADGSKTSVWRRTPQEEALSILLGGSAGPVVRDVPGSDGLQIHTAERPLDAAVLTGTDLAAGRRSVSCFLVNRRRPDEAQPERAYAFQAEIEVRTEEGFMPRPDRRGAHGGDWDDRVADLPLRRYAGVRHLRSSLTGSRRTTCSGRCAVGSSGSSAPVGSTTTRSSPSPRISAGLDAQPIIRQ